ncbi:MAG TPA: tyrosine phosphatase family protein [Pararhizobium sp.]|nr:tyrosine phosphatase family protein [Pararhizobium sp.]
MPYIIVSPLSRLAETVVAHGVREMVSLIGRNHEFHRPAVIDERRHLLVDVNDIAAEAKGLILAQEHHVDRLFRFAQGWDRRAPLVVHCWMGISRSPAAALLVALALNPEQDEDLLARRLRAASPFATPNARLIEIGDGMLGRDGRLIRAVRAIGRGADAYEGLPFTLTLKPEDPMPAPSLPAAADG